MSELANNANPAPKRRWFQFSLLALMIFVGLALGLIHWGYRGYLARQARAEYERTSAAWKAQTVVDEQLLAALDEQLKAALAVPFSDKKQAYREYLDELAKFVLRGMIYYGGMYGARAQQELFESIKSADRRYDKAYQQLKRLAGSEFADRIKADHDKEIDDDWRRVGTFTHIHQFQHPIE